MDMKSISFSEKALYELLKRFSSKETGIRGIEQGVREIVSKINTLKLTNSSISFSFSVHSKLKFPLVLNEKDVNSLLN
jgi:ATP-dependent Lon protease